VPPRHARAEFQLSRGVPVGARGLDLAADLPQPLVGRPRLVLGVEQRDEPLGAHEQALKRERIITRQGPDDGEDVQVSLEAEVVTHRAGLEGPARLWAVTTAPAENTPVRIPGNPASVQTHWDLPGSSGRMPKSPAAGRQRYPLTGTAAPSSATSLDADLSSAFTLPLHPRSARGHGVSAAGTRS